MKAEKPAKPRRGRDAGHARHGRKGSREGQAVAEAGAAGDQGSLGRRSGASRTLGLRLGLVGALVLLVLPLIAAAWAFGSYAADNERARSDTRLTGSLRAAVSEYGRIVEEGQVEALRLAGTRAVQNALRTNDRAALARLRRGSSSTRSSFPGHTRPEKAPGTAQRSVEVVVGTKPVGSVAVDVVLDNAVLGRLADAAGLMAHNEIAVAERSGRVVAASGVDLRPGRARQGIATPRHWIPVATATARSHPRSRRARASPSSSRPGRSTQPRPRFATGSCSSASSSSRP